MKRNISIQEYVRKEPFVEIVERKGLGHPDTICDSIMDAISVELSKEYLKRVGHILHHNTDKSLLVAGSTDIKFGGGEVIEPMKLIIGDRATFKTDGVDIPVNDIAVKTAKNWFKNNLRFVDPDSVIYQSELRPGSPELVSIFKKKGILEANDTSAAVGYAPLSKTEKLVLRTEKHLNSKKFKKKFPESGEDIKIMSLRRKEEISLNIAIAFVDKFIKNEKNYFGKKERILRDIKKFTGVDDVSLNMLDKKGRGINGVYLTVTGTSAESGDCGQVGRGNRVNGLIPLLRPAGSEAAAGKNPVSHVGKIYNTLSNHVASQIYKNIDGIEEVYVWMVTKIGRLINKPMVSVHIALKKCKKLPEKKIENEIKYELDHIQDFCMKLAKGKIQVC